MTLKAFALGRLLQRSLLGCPQLQLLPKQPNTISSMSTLSHALSPELGRLVRATCDRPANSEVLKCSPKLIPFPGLSYPKAIFSAPTTLPSQRLSTLAADAGPCKSTLMNRRQVSHSHGGLPSRCALLPVAFEKTSKVRWGRRSIAHAAASESVALEVPASEPQTETLDTSRDPPLGQVTSAVDQLETAPLETEIGPEEQSESVQALSESVDIQSKALAGTAEKVAAAAVLPKTKPPFPKQNQELELVCESLAYGGSAVCRVLDTGFVMMCNGALPGEKLLARVMRKKRSMAQALKLKTLEPPPNLVEPPCKHFEDCGGCKTQNWAYEAQVAEKQKQVEELIIRVGRFPRGSGWMKAAVPCEERFKYRNKMEFSFGNRLWTSAAPEKAPRTPPGTAKKPPQRGTDFGLGLHAPGRFDKILPIDECWLQDDAGNRALRIVTEWARANQAECPVYDTLTHDGFLRHLTIRKGSDSDTGAVQLMLNVQTAYSKPELLQPVVDRLVAEVPEVASIVNNVNESPGCGSVGKQEHLLYGKPYIKERLRGLEFEISANSFFQTNTKQAEVLYSLVEDACGLSGDKSEVILDLFCGTGTIGLSMAHRAKHVYGYELVPEAVADAVRNAERNGISNATFIQGDLNKLKEDFGTQFQTPDIVITDPNRPGMHPKLLRFLSQCGAKRIVYVSCNPSTQARDLDVLCHGEENRGDGVGPYDLVSVQPVDMFPHTSHIESVAVLDLRPWANAYLRESHTLT